MLYVWDKSHQYGSKNDAENYRYEHREKDRRVRRYIPGGSSEKFGTCPASCELNPSGTGCSDGQIDFDYLDAVLDAKPRRGFSFTYSHFHPLFWSHKLSSEKTVINYSAATPDEAVLVHEAAPTVTVVKPEYWISAPVYEYELGVAGLHKYRRIGGTGLSAARQNITTT